MPDDQIRIHTKKRTPSDLLSGSPESWRISVAAGASSHVLGQDVLIFSEQDQRLYELNPAAAFIWGCCERGMSPVQITGALAKEAAIPLSVAEADLRNVLLAWLFLGVLTNGDEQYGYNEGGLDEGPIHFMEESSHFSLRSECAGQIRFRLAGSNFLVRFSHQEQSDPIRAMFAHLESDGDSIDGVMDIVHEEDGHLLVVDGAIIERTSPTLDLVSLVSHEVIRGIYRKHDFLLAMHAAAVGNGRRCALLPGPSGAGKTTLTVGLVHDGFHYLTDEVAIVERGTHRVIPCPLSLRIKEGAWEAASRMLDSWMVDEQPGDNGTLIRYATPPHGRFLTEPSDGLTVGCIVFPQYRPDSPTELLPMSKIDALRHIQAAGCEAGPLMDSRTIDELLEWIDGIDCYELHVHSLSSAVSALRGLLH